MPPPTAPHRGLPVLLTGCALLVGGLLASTFGALAVANEAPGSGVRGGLAIGLGVTAETASLVMIPLGAVRVKRYNDWKKTHGAALHLGVGRTNPATTFGIRGRF